MAGKKLRRRTQTPPPPVPTPEPEEDGTEEDTTREKASARTLKQRQNHGVLNRGWTRSRLIIELARGELTQADLARKYGVTHPAISHFKKKWASEIETAALAIQDEFVSLWSADKRARVAEYEQDIVDLNHQIREEMELSLPDTKRLGVLYRAKHMAVRNIAEELGQLPSKMTIRMDNTPVTFKVEGLDPEALK